MAEAVAECPFGKASLVFPLSISAGAALGLLAATECAHSALADVIGYSTPLIIEAGACSVRLALQGLESAAGYAPGNYAAALRAEGHAGWLPGLANTKHCEDGRLLLEFVGLVRPDSGLGAVMYLPAETLQALWPCGAGHAHVRLLQPLLLPQLSDCPGQWLRDRLLKLADMVDVRFASPDVDSSTALRQALLSAGLRMVDSLSDSSCVGPADRDSRIDDKELGYWKEEMDHGHRCAGSMEGGHRLDVPDDIIAAML